MASKKSRSHTPSTIFHPYPWAKCDFWTKLLTKAKDFRKTVLGLSVKQINEHTELFITCDPVKEGRAVKYVTFTVKPQAVGTPIIDLDAIPSILPGVQQRPYENAVKILDEFRIADKFRLIWGGWVKQGRIRY